MSNQVGFTVDVNQCISCRACEMACKVEYNLAAGEGRRRRVIERTVDNGGKIRTFFISLACNHCENPACVAACPSSTISNPTSQTGWAGKKALYKTTAADAGVLSSGLVGVVRLNADKCIACRRCEWACPYGAPQYDPSGKSAGVPAVHKCEFCHERIGAWKTAWSYTGDQWATGSGVSAEAFSDKRRQTACAATCLGRALVSTLVDPTTGDETRGRGAPTITYRDYEDQVDIGTNVMNESTGVRNSSTDNTTARRTYVRCGETGNGSAYLSSYTLTHPALKVCNRLYKNREGGSTA